jgi:hypothetical protein
MSEDKEWEVIEKTRRNQSEIHVMSGNINKVNGKVPKSIYSDNEVRSPLKAVGILAATFLASLVFISVIYLISTLLGG